MQTEPISKITNEKKDKALVHADFCQTQKNARAKDLVYSNIMCKLSWIFVLSFYLKRDYANFIIFYLAIDP